MTIVIKFLTTVKRVLDFSSAPKWFIPILVMLGLAVGLAESLGISIIVLFLYSMLDRTSEILRTEGIIGIVFRGLDFYIGSYIGTGISLIILIFALIVINITLSLIYTLMTECARYRLSKLARNRLSKQFLGVSYSFILNHDQGKLQNVWNGESWLIGEAYFYINRIFINVSCIVVFTALLYALSWQLFLVAVIGIVFLFGGMHFLWGSVRRLGQNMKLEHESITKQMLITLQCMRTLRVFALEQQWHQQFKKVSAEVEQTSIRFEQYRALVTGSIQIGYIFLLVAIILVSNHANVPFSGTLAFVAFLYRLQPSVNELQCNILAILQLEDSISDFFRVLDRSDKVYLNSGREPFTGLKREIRFDRVSLAYPGSSSPSLDQISFTIPAGSITAFIGPSGAGKTTIINLLLRLYQPDLGSILVDGVYLQELDRASWLENIAVAGQDMELLEGTISYNLGLAAPQSERQAMYAAAEVAGILDALEHLPEGLDTWVGNQGLKLSGGQRQRLGLARALLRESDIIVLDEATSSLDRGLENKIFTTLRDRLAGRTIVMITHRLETAMSADQVIIISSGRVIESASPAELRRRPASVFWTLFPEEFEKHNSTDEFFAGNRR
jgi:ATP-binding cassette, subfamily B, bacterial MsbA